MASILDLPAELIINIFGHIEEVNDVCAARLSSKHLTRSSSAHFGKRYFRKKGFLITTPSLGVLKSIANHSEFHKYVRHIWFNPDLWTGREPVRYRLHDRDGEEESCEWCLAEGLPDCFVYTATIDDHMELFSTSRLEEELTHSLRGLHNLETIGMRRSEDYKPWGYRTLHTAFGTDPRVLGNFSEGPDALSNSTLLFQAMMHSLAAANVRVKRLYTDAIEVDNILPERLPQETLDRACNSILYLEFNAWKAHLGYQVPKPPYKVLREVSDYGEGMSRLFKATPNLLELGLQVFPDAINTRRRAIRENFDRYRGSYPYHAFAKLNSNIRLDRLTRLKLENIITEAGILTSFLEASQSSLISLKMRDMRLLVNASNRRPWQNVFEFLRDNCLDLAYLFLYHLKYEGGGVAFVAQPEIMIQYHDTPRGDTYTIAGEEHFTDYHNITLELKGREEVREGLERIAEKHWYQRPIYSYAMDESVWHTDTSDDEW